MRPIHPIHAALCIAAAYLLGRFMERTWWTDAPEPDETETYTEHDGEQWTYLVAYPAATTTVN